MIKNQCRCGWLATGLLLAAVFGLWVRPVGAQGFSGSSGSSSSGSGFSGSSSGSGFSGSSSGSGFSGSSSGSGFSGSSSGSGFSGTSTSTSTGSTYRSGSSSGTTGKVVPQPSDPFRSYYANPYTLGVTTGTSTSTSTSTPTATFGQPLYGTVNTPTTTTGTGNLGGSGSSGSGFTTIGMRRAPAYTTSLGFAPPAAPAAGIMQMELRGVLERSTMFDASGIELQISGPVVILKGRVANENERRLAEGVVRLTPGVYEVRNELKVPGLQVKITP